MKRILSMLLVLVMVISMLPLAVSAAEVSSGLATASRDSKWTYRYTAPADGTLKITVGDGSAAWVSDVMNFNDYTTSEAVSGTEQASYNYAVTAGTVYSVRIYGTGTTSAEIVDVPYTIEFISASGEEDTGITVKGAVMTDDSGAAMQGTDLAVTASGIKHIFTPNANGVVTVHIISSSTGWKYTGEGTPFADGTGEAAPTFEVAAGQTYSITLGCYENHDFAAGTISYEILFYESELTVTQEPYIISETVIAPAEEAVTTTVTMEENADMTVVTITPSVVGVYTITVPEGTALLNNVGGGAHYIEAWDADEAASTIEWTCEEVGHYEEVTFTDENGNGTITEEQWQEGLSMMLGIMSDADTVEVTVTKTADYVPVVVETITYENKAELSQFTMPEGAALGNYVDVYGDTHTAVLGEDGYYHLDSEDGPVLLIDMDRMGNTSGAAIVLSAALNSDRPVMYAYVTLEDGTEVKYDIGNAVKEYEAVMDADGYYPLTEDLILFYENYATGAGIWTYHLSEGYNEECAWMYCCRTVTLPATSGTVTIGTHGEFVDWTAPADGTVKFTVTPSENIVPVFNKGEYQPVLVIDAGSATLDVTAGNVYEIMSDYNNTSTDGTTVAWEYVEDSEGGDEGGEDEEPAATALALGDNALELAEGNRNGGTWTYTATEDGTLTATVSYLKYYVQSYEVEGEYDSFEATTESDLANACGKLMQFMVNGYNAFTNTQSVQVKAGDVVTVQLISNYGYRTEATLNLSMSEGSGEDEGGDTIEGDGTQANPYIITKLPYTVSVQGNHDLYYRYTVANNGTLKISYMLANYVSSLPSNYVKDSENRCYTVEVTAGQVIDMNLWGTTTGDYVISFIEDEAPDGGETSNALVLGDNAVELADGDFDGETWTFVPAESGTLNVTVSAMSSYNAMTGTMEEIPAEYLAGQFMRGQYSLLVNNALAASNTTTVAVVAGEEVTIQLYGQMAAETTATINLALTSGEGGDTEPEGSESNPYIIESLPATLTGAITTDAGVFYQYTAVKAGVIETSDESGCIVSVYVNGEIQSFPLTVAAGDVITINPWAVSVPSDYSVTVSYQDSTVDPDVPAEEGTESNPIVIENFPSQTAVTLTSDNAETGFWYKYTVTEDCLLNAEMDNWGYAELTVNGSSEWTPVQVSAGDVVVIHAYSYNGAGDYTLSLSDATVAMVGETRYSYFSSALYAAVSGDTITMLADADATNLQLNPGITLDLNGYTMTASYVAVFKGANIVDNSAANTGLLAVLAENVLISSTNSQLPVWNGNGYVFSTVDHSRARQNGQTDDSFGFAFQPRFQTAVTELLSDGGADNGVTIEVRVSWMSDMGREYRNLVFKEEQVTTVIPSANGAFLLTFSGFSAIDMQSDILVEAIVRSETGVVVASAGTTVTIG